MRLFEAAFLELFWKQKRKLKELSPTAALACLGRQATHIGD